MFFENAGNRDTLVATGVVPEGRDVVLHGAGVNLVDYPCQPYPQDDTVCFLFVGRVMHEKGVDELFAATRRMKQQYGERVAFHIVGSFEEAYKPVMDELEQAGMVRYHGYQSDMKPFYAMASCVVLCPARDADALYEAMRRFVELPQTQRAEMGLCGRARMEQQFSKQAVVAETIRALRGSND